MKQASHPSPLVCPFLAPMNTRVLISSPLRSSWPLSCLSPFRAALLSLLCDGENKLREQWGREGMAAYLKARCRRSTSASQTPIVGKMLRGPGPVGAHSNNTTSSTQRI